MTSPQVFHFGPNPQPQGNRWGMWLLFLLGCGAIAWAAFTGRSTAFSCQRIEPRLVNCQMQPYWLGIAIGSDAELAPALPSLFHVQARRHTPRKRMPGPTSSSS